MTTLPNTVKLIPLLLPWLLFGVVVVAPITTQAQMTTWGNVPTYTCEGQGASVKVNSRIGRYGLDKGSHSLRKIYKVASDLYKFGGVANIPPLYPLEASLNLFSVFEDGPEIVEEREMQRFTASIKTSDDTNPNKEADFFTSIDPEYSKELLPVKDKTIEFIRQQLSNHFGAKKVLGTDITLPSEVYAREDMTRGEALSEIMKLPKGDHVLLVYWDHTKANPTPKVTVLFKDLEGKSRLFDPSLSDYSFKAAYKTDLFNLKKSNPLYDDSYKGGTKANYRFTIFGINREIPGLNNINIDDIPEIPEIPEIPPLDPETIPPDKQGGAGPGPYNP